MYICIYYDIHLGCTLQRWPLAQVAISIACCIVNPQVILWMVRVQLI